MARHPSPVIIVSASLPSIDKKHSRLIASQEQRSNSHILRPAQRIPRMCRRELAFVLRRRNHRRDHRALHEPWAEGVDVDPVFGVVDR